MERALPLLICATFLPQALAADADALRLEKVNQDLYRLVVAETGRQLAVTRPDHGQGNVRVFSRNGKHCGVNWPHFLMYSDGHWLTDAVESEGLRLVEFEVRDDSGAARRNRGVGYRGKWKFRDYFTTSEQRFTWYDRATATQFHLVDTELEILKDLDDISSVWVEFMTRENSYATVAAKTKDGRVVTLDVSKTGKLRNMHYFDGEELAENGWIAIYGARNGQDACAAFVPLEHSPGPMRPRVNNGHVDNIEVHLLDARQYDILKAGQRFRLQYILIVAPDQPDWKWIEPAAEKAKVYVEQAVRSNLIPPRFDRSS